MIDTDLLSKLICPRTGEQLALDGDCLVNLSRSERYAIEGGIPDLRRAPERLQIDLPWYEPWDDLEAVPICCPPASDETDLPYHLDKYLVNMVPRAGDGKWLLELGCGERQNEEWYVGKDYRYLGVDIGSRGIGPNILADGHNLPIASESIDYCVSLAVMEHVVSPLTVASEVHRVLAPGGVFFGSAAFVYGFHDRASFYHISHAGLLTLLSQVGFKVELLWPDWAYPDSISEWPFRGIEGAPWRWMTRYTLQFAEWSFRMASNTARRLVGKECLDIELRDISMAGSVSFRATKPQD